MNKNDIKSYTSILLLNEMITNKRIFETILNGDDKLLEPFFIEMLSHNYLSIVKNKYVVSAAGKTSFDTFMKRYNEYLKLYDIFSLVDLDKGEFAFQKYFDFDENSWNIFKNNARFFDVRIAVCEYKKLNPYEIVFMSFINENRFDTSISGWQFDILSEEIWKEIEEIVNTAITINDLGKDVIEDIIKQGTQIAIELIVKDNEIQKQKLEDEDLENEEIEEITTTIEVNNIDCVYYDNYYDDCLFVSLFWCDPLFIW
jgi:hypothetical protein